ncbi:MAG: T9SS type A sorting domain-containing protein [Bacteroidota bacterium]|nr:T9SS type A sorting domain-containing protein [Bacteroidota bacterium]
MKKLNIHFKIVILISLLLVSVNISYSQWTIVGDLAAIIGPRPIVSVVDGNTAFVTGGETINATYKTTNGGTNWIQLNTSIFRPFWSICAKDANTVFAGDDGTGGRINFYKTTNGGINWTLIDSISGVTAVNNGFRGIRFSNSIPSFGIAYAEGNNGDFYIYKTRDGGNIWTRSLIPGYPGYRITGGLNVIDSLFYAFGTFRGPPSMIITTDGGVTWNLRNVDLPSGGNNVTRGLAFNENKLTGIAGSSSTPSIARTTTGGLNWLEIDVGNIVINHLGPIMRWIEGTNICYLTAKEPSLIGGVMSGVLKSTDGGLNWTPMTTSDLGIIYMDTKRIGSNIYGYSISTLPGAFGGNLVLKVTDAIVGINQISELVPDGYNLSQNYPNPFNPITVIRYSLIENRFATLKVYDMLGNEITTLVNEKQNAGTYEVDFDGSNFSSGVYFYKLLVDGNIIDTKRMVLLK